jgi:two-component system cell cycle sensor histidine kinase/response regulator CckA
MLMTTSFSRSAADRRRRALSTFAALLLAGGSAALLLWAIGDLRFTGAFLAAILACGALLLLGMQRAAASAEPVPDAPAAPDMALLRAALDASPTAAAITDADGALVSANEGYVHWFGGTHAPTDLPFEEAERAALRKAALGARRDGRGEASRLKAGDVTLRADAVRAGLGDSHLVWTFSRAENADLVGDAQRLLAGEAGVRVGEAGLMALLADSDGNIVSANPAFLARIGGRVGDGLSLVDLIGVAEEGYFYFLGEGKGAVPLRLVQVPLSEGPDPLTLFLLLDDPAGLTRLRNEDVASLSALLDFIPLGLALANIDGRFI